MDFSCSKCEFTSSLQPCIRHFILKHVDSSDVPIYCNLCGYRATNIRLFNQHLTKLKIHLKLVTEEKQEKNYLQKGRHYNVTWGKGDSNLELKKEKDDSHTDDDLLEPVLELDDPKEISVFKELNDCGVQTETDESNTKMKRLQRENSHLGAYIQRLEEKIENLSKELRESKEEIRRIERYVSDGAGDYGFEEMWREHEVERRNRRRVRSAVVVIGNKKRRV